MPGGDMWPAMDAVLMIAPPSPWARMWGRKASKP